MLLFKPLAALQVLCNAVSGYRWLIFLLVAGMLLFAHGCHTGGHDDELLTEITITAAK